MRANFTDSQKKAIAAQYWKGTAVSRLCLEHKVPRSTLYSWIKLFKPLQTSDPETTSNATQKEYSELRRRVDKQDQILEVIQSSRCSPTAPLDERLTAFQKLRGQYSDRVLCEALNVARGTYYKRIVKGDNPTMYARRREEIGAQVLQVFEESEQRYGADKIVAALQAKGVKASKKYVLSLMHEMGLQSIGSHSKKDYKKLLQKQNIVQRQFKTDSPNQVWVSDVTYFKVKEHHLYTCVIIDLFSRKVIAYRVSLRNSTQLITQTFKNAFALRGCPSGLTFHSDRGAQYTSATFRKLLIHEGVVQSFSNPGAPHDNAVAESFFALLKREELYRRNYRSEHDFRESVNNYIRFYNSERPHRATGYQSPDQFEAVYFEKAK